MDNELWNNSLIGAGLGLAIGLIILGKTTNWFSNKIINTQASFFGLAIGLYIAFEAVKKSRKEKIKMKYLRTTTLSCILLLFAGCTQLPNNLSNNGCPPGIIPTSMKFQIHPEAPKIGGMGGQAAFLQLQESWNDGTRIGFSNPVQLMITCTHGEKEGENVNYWYCRDLKYTNTKLIVSEDGTIKNSREFDLLITLTLKEVGRRDLGTHTPIDEGNFTIIHAECRQSE
ncbi:MAG: hypothetical protein V1735_04505 [Nanoarchaeota archaeon]